MQQADWTSAGMDGLANQLTDSGVCRSCHQAGLFGVFLSSDSTQSFQHMKSPPFLYKLAALEANADGSFKAIVPANRFSARGAEVTLSHPSYSLDAANQRAIDQFFTLTMQRYTAGNCQ
jgi:hypothetical protein